MSASQLQGEKGAMMDQFLAITDEIESIPEDEEENQARFKHLVQLKTKKYAHASRSVSHSLPRVGTSCASASTWCGKRSRRRRARRVQRRLRRRAARPAL